MSGFRNSGSTTCQGLLTCMLPKGKDHVFCSEAASPRPTQPGILLDTEWVLIELKSNELKIALTKTHPPPPENSINIHRPLTPEGVNLQTPGAPVLAHLPTHLQLSHMQGPDPLTVAPATWARSLGASRSSVGGSQGKQPLSGL